MRLCGWRRGSVVALVVVAFGMFAAAAMADGPARFVGQFGATGSGNGDLNAAAGLAVDPSTGDVLVADDDNERIDVFDSSGTFLKAWGAGVADGSSITYQTCDANTTPCRQGVASGSAGGLNRPKGVAVDSAGNVFVADSANNRVDEFDSSGEFLKAWGWGVIPGRTAAFQTCTMASGCQAGSANGGDGAGALGSPYGVAVGPSRDVFVAEFGNSRVSVFDPSSATATFLRTWGWGVADQQQQFEICTSGCHAGGNGTGAGGQAGGFDGLSGIAVDPASGDVYVMDSDNYRVQQFHPSGDFVGTWGWGVADGKSQLETCSSTASSSPPGCQPGLFGHGGAGQFANAIAQPVGIAVDATGNVDAVDEDNNRVQQFAPGGAFQNMFGYGVADGQNTFENCPTTPGGSTSGCQQGKSGTDPGQLFGPAGIAADAAGDVYVDNGNVIEHYSVRPACDDTFTGASGGDWNDAANWSAGVPGSSTVACWTGKTVVVSSAVTAGSVQGGDLSITGGSLTLADAAGRSWVGGLSLGDGGLDGPSGARLSVDGDFNWSSSFSGNVNGAAGSGLAISQTAGHTFTMGGSGQENFQGGSIQTASPVQISDLDLTGANGASLTTSSTVTFAPGSYNPTGGGIAITTAGVITTGDTTIPTFGLHLTASASSLFSRVSLAAGPATLSPASLSSDAGATLTIPAGARVIGGPGAIAGTITGQGSFVQSSGSTEVSGGGALSVDHVTVAAGTLTVDAGASYDAAGSTSLSGGELDLDNTASTGALTITGGGLEGSSPASLTLNGDFTWNSAFTSNINGNAGSALAISQATGHSFTIGDSHQALFYGGSIQTPNPVQITDPQFAGSRGPTLSTTSAVTFAPGSYDANGGQGMTISAAGVSMSGDTTIPNFALKLTGGSSTIPSGQTLAPATVTVQGGTLQDDGTLSAPTTVSGGTLKGTGTITGNLANTGGTVSPGDSPGTLGVTGNYTQASGGTLAIQVDGTSSFSTLTVGGNVTLDGTLDLVPSSSYASSAQPGDKVGFLSYSGSLTGQFAATTVNPSLASQRTFTPDYGTAHLINATVGGGTAQHTLNITTEGSGSGSVTSSPSGVDCGSTCSAQFDDGTQVTLTATPGSGSTFTGWSGGGCSGTGTCQVTLSADTAVTATFAHVQRTLTVSKAGSGSGTVTSSPAGIDCGGTCSASFDDGTQVTLTAAHGSGSTFTGWSGCGSVDAQNRCVVAMSADKTVTATFVVGTQATTTSLTASVNGETVGVPVTYIATISPVPNGGTVEFTQGGNAIAGCAAVAVDTSVGEAGCQISFASAGSYAVQAVYSGTSSFAGSQSSTLTQQVVTATTLNSPCPTPGPQQTTVGGLPPDWSIQVGSSTYPVDTVTGLQARNDFVPSQALIVYISTVACGPADVALRRAADNLAYVPNPLIVTFHDSAGNTAGTWNLSGITLVSPLDYCPLSQQPPCVTEWKIFYRSQAFSTSSYPAQAGSSATVTNGRAAVLMTCHSSRPCAGTVTLSLTQARLAATQGNRMVVVGKTHFKVKPHHKAKLRIRLSKAALSLLKHAHALRAQLRIDPAGVPSALSLVRSIKLVTK